MKVLHLTLKKKWFDMILSGEKKEEYREIKPYWIKRLIQIDYPKEEKDDHKNIPENILYDLLQGYDQYEVLVSYFSDFKHFDIIRFTNGYSPTSTSFDIECKGITIGLGKKEWGAPVPEQTFIISLGNIISKTNI